jgi:hypothetical protein
MQSAGAKTRITRAQPPEGDSLVLITAPSTLRFPVQITLLNRHLLLILARTGVPHVQENAHPLGPPWNPRHRLR